MAAWYGNGAGRGGPAKGAGWGGPKREPIPFTADSETRVTNATDDNHDPVEQTYRKDRRSVRRARTERLENILFDIAESAKSDETKVSAATKLHAIYNGQPVARNINLSIDDISELSDDDLRAELERTGGAPPALDAGDAPEGMPN
jgi:hypothetical protein